MAPNPLRVVFDYRGQIGENCEFLCDKDDFVSVITAKDAEARHKAIAVRTNGDDRGAFLASDPCETVQEALDSLHAKSEEAVQLYININGYSQPPSLKKNTFDDDDDTASVFSDQSYSSSIAAPRSVSGSTDSEVITPASSSREKSTADRPAKGLPNPSRKAPPHKEGPKASPRTTYDSDTDDSVLGSSRCSPKPVEPGRSQTRAAYTAYMPPQPPAAPVGYWGNLAPPPPPPPANLIRAPAVPRIPSTTIGTSPSPIPMTGVTPPPAPPGPMGRPPMPSVAPKPPKLQRPVVVSPPRLFPVRLTIEWFHHGQTHILESCRPSVASLAETARAFVCRRPSSFANVTPRERINLSLGSVQATVKRAFFGDGRAYDISAGTQDLTKWFTVVGANDIPRFEVEIMQSLLGTPSGAPVAAESSQQGPDMSPLHRVVSAGAGPGRARKTPGRPDALSAQPVSPGLPGGGDEVGAEEARAAGSKCPGSTGSLTHTPCPPIIECYQDHFVVD